MQVLKSASVYSLYKYTFLPRTVPEWNRLDDQSNCIELFKQKLANIT